MSNIKVCAKQSDNINVITGGSNSVRVGRIGGKTSGVKVRDGESGSLKVRVGQTDGIKITSTGLQRSDTAINLSGGGVADVTQLDVSGQSNLNNLYVTGISTFKSNNFGAVGIFIDTINDQLNVGLGVTIAPHCLSVDGQGIFNSLLVSGITKLGFNSGITTTGGNLFVGNDLFVKNNLKIDQLSEFVGSATFQNNVSVEGTLTAGLIDGGSF